MEGLEFIFVVTIASLFYFIPGIIAIARNHHNRLAIWVTNFLLGWIMIGWIVALIWSLTAVRKE